MSLNFFDLFNADTLGFYGACLLAVSGVFQFIATFPERVKEATALVWVQLGGFLLLFLGGASVAAAALKLESREETANWWLGILLIALLLTAAGLAVLRRSTQRGNERPHPEGDQAAVSLASMSADGSQVPPGVTLSEQAPGHFEKVQEATSPSKTVDTKEGIEEVPAIRVGHYGDQQSPGPAH